MKYIRNLALVGGMAFGGCGEENGSIGGLEDQCASDYDCKGDRVCKSESVFGTGGAVEIRQCVSPNGSGSETPSVQEEVDLEDTTCEGSPLNGMYVRGLPGCKFHSVEPGNPETCKMEISFYKGGSAYLHYNSEGQVWLEYHPEIYELYGHQEDYLYRITRSYDLDEIYYGIETDGHGEFVCDMNGNMTPSDVERYWRMEQCMIQQFPNMHGLRMEFIDGPHEGDMMVCIAINSLNKLEASKQIILSDDSCIESRNAQEIECLDQ